GREAVVGDDGGDGSGGGSGDLSWMEVATRSGFLAADERDLSFCYSGLSLAVDKGLSQPSHDLARCPPLVVLPPIFTTQECTTDSPKNDTGKPGTCPLTKRKMAQTIHRDQSRLHT
ncbi:hypothetical protein BaRGS_00002590, partial [Batillaria attramentaria]